MNYRFFIGLFTCICFFSCSIEKKLYSPGYHVEWFQLNSKSQKTDFHKEPDATQIISASENSEVLLNSEVYPSPSIKLEVTLKDTVIPDNPAKTDEEYVTPEFNNDESQQLYSTENIVITPKDAAKIDALTKYLIKSAILSIPFFYLYIPILLTNLIVIERIKRYARFSPYQNYYLEKIKKYWRIMRWPLYFFGFCILMALLLLFALAVTSL